MMKVSGIEALQFITRLLTWDQDEMRFVVYRSIGYVVVGFGIPGV